jgi:hypothetical protein
MTPLMRLAVFVGILVVAGGIVLFAPGSRRVFIAGDRPVSEEQVRVKLQADGYSNVQISRQGRWFDVTATKDGKKTDMAINAETGRLADEPFKDADEQD